MNILEELDNIIKEFDKDKQRIVIHPFTYNKYKNKFDEIKKEYFVTIVLNGLIPVDKVIVMESERDSEERFEANSDPILGYKTKIEHEIIK